MRPAAWLLALLLAGCGMKGYRFTRPDFDYAQFRKDDYECIYQTRLANQSVDAVADLVVGASRDFHRLCMEAKGYTAVR